MLPKKKRLNLRLIDLLLFFKQAKRFNTFHFRAFYRVVKIDNDEVCRMAVIVPKKVSLKAVERNRLKRQAYAVCNKLFFSEKEINNFKNKINSKQLQIIYVMKRQALLATQKELKNNFQKLLLALSI